MIDVVVGASLAILVVMLVPVVLWERRNRSRAHRPRRFSDRAASFGNPATSLNALADPVRVAAKALICMPSLNPTGPIPLRFAASFLGWDTFSGTPLWEQHENSKLISAGPRMGKTLLWVRRYVEDAPGPCVVTSTKGEIARLAEARLISGDWAGVFDPGRSYAGTLPRVRWDPLRGCESPRTAMNRASAMMGGANDSDNGTARFFNVAATIVLQCLLHAAAISGRTMRDVVDWAADFSDSEPLTILSTQAYQPATGWYRKLRAQTTGDASVTTDSTRKTLANALRIFDDPDVLEDCCPPREESFDLDSFIIDSGRPLLTIISDPAADGGSAAPITTAFCSALLSSAKRLSQNSDRSRQHEGNSPRLSPCLRFVGDEYCNIAPIPDTDKLMSDTGGRGIELILFVQNRDQLLDRFGRTAGRAIHSAANLRAYLGGSTDVEELEELSRLVGSRQVELTSVTRSRREVSSSTHFHEKPVLTATDLRELDDGRALVLYTNKKATLVDVADIDPRTGRMAYRPTPEIVVSPRRLGRALDEKRSWYRFGRAS